MNENLVNWSWQKAKEQAGNIWFAGSKLPDGLFATGDLVAVSKNAFERSPVSLFEPLQMLQPNVWQALTGMGESLCLIQDKKYPNLLDFAKPVGDLVVYLNPFHSSDDLRDWKNIFLGMPDFLCSYYKDFNGMHASYNRVNGPIALNLPGNVRKWRRVNDYQKERGLKKNKISKISKELGDSENILIFLETEWRDLFMLNLNKNDKKIYVAPQEDFDNFFELEEPAARLDALCAHVISGAATPYYTKR